MNLLQLPKTAKQKTAKPFFTRQIIAVSALSLLGAPSFAQTGFDFGVKGIVQSSSMISLQDQAAGNELNYKDRLGIGGGVAAGYSFTKHVGAEIDFLYSQQGTSYTGDAALITSADKSRICTSLKNMAAIDNIPFTSGYTANVYVNYIKIPILFRYNTNNTKKVFFSLFIGPQFDLLSSANITINGQTASLAAYGLKTDDMYKKSEVDGVLGLGLGINLSKHFVLTGHLRFDFGAGDAENKGATYTYQGTAYNYYSPSRGNNMNATGGGLISLNYKLLKKGKEVKKKDKKTTSETDNNDDDGNETQTKTKTKTKTTTPPPAMQPSK